MHVRSCHTVDSGEVAKVLSVEMLADRPPTCRVVTSTSSSMAEMAGEKGGMELRCWW
jgi:hypothetical protein